MDFDLDNLLNESERKSKSNSPSRRLSNESTCSINLTTNNDDSTNSTNIYSISENLDKPRSKSLINIAKFQKLDQESTNNNNNNNLYLKDTIDENSPIHNNTFNYRRNSLQNEIGKCKDAFGPQLSHDPFLTLPGTPLPSLVQENPEDEVLPVEFPTSITEAVKDKCMNPDTLYFRDGTRKIDMVLVYEEEEFGVMTEIEAKRQERRRIFQENLIKEGLELELEHKDISYDGKTWFLKIHIPWKIKTRYAAVLGMKLPTKRFITISVKAWDDEKNNNTKETFWSRFMEKWKQFRDYDYELIPDDPSFFEVTKGGDREEQFVVKDRHTCFSSAQRSYIVMQILLRTKFDDTDRAGIRRLLNDNTYVSCFPLHEGRWDRSEDDGKILDRRLLYMEWARPGRWMKKQPFNLIRTYFGDKICLYFCWLGFYTKMLVAPAVVGTLCFCYGLFTIDSPDNIPTKEICDPLGPGNITLCPLCDKACKYQKLKESCKFARLTYLFDNPATVFFAIFMSLWATIFLELWKRKQRVIQWEWDLQDGSDKDEEPRPEFETTTKTFRTNPVTREKEPYIPTWSKTFRFFATSSAVFFMVVVVLCAVLGTIIYRLSLVSVIYGGGGSFLKKHAKIVTSVSAAVMNLIIIMSLTRFYHKLAIYLTNLENPRTQTEYEDSYTFKIFLFEFMNFYSSLIYIAFFKGRFYEYPGDTATRSSEFLRVKGDVCDPAGCLSELCIQLSIIMVGKQILNNFVELFNPKFYNWWRYRSHRSHTKDLTRKNTRWEEDYHLQDPGRLALFDEYLEMILQYGFVTLFVAAFPLAPLCAFLNNVAEIRLDAYKMVTQARRPLAEKVEDLGAWYGILRAITYTAIVSNAFVIAYTSDFIPRMVYQYKYSPTDDLVGYIDASLSTFNTSDYHDVMGGDDDKAPPETCQYRGYRNGPNETDPYGLSPQYWHVFAARLAFVVVFEHIVFALTGLMQCFIPDIPTELKTQMSREAMLAKEAKYEHGLKRANDFDYDELLANYREQNNNNNNNNININNNNNNNNSKYDNKAIGIKKGIWARRLSRLSDGLDAHVEVASKKQKCFTSTVWEVTEGGGGGVGGVVGDKNKFH